MVRLIGNKKINIAVFISGRGSNLKSLINFSKKNPCIKISCVVSNNKFAKGLKHAKKNKIECMLVNYKNKNSAEKKIVRYLKEKEVKLIALAGFMKILSQNFIKKFKKPILNIHPSLLPKYKGLNTHKRALNNKEKYTGCTVHLVNKTLDSGKILIQKRVKIFNNDTQKSLERRVLKKEHDIYPRAIIKLISNL